MSNENIGGPAFPNPHFNDVYGMDLRDYFAAKAMQAWISATVKPYMHKNQHCVETLENSTVALHAYKQADAMLQAREGGAA